MVAEFTANRCKFKNMAEKNIKKQSLADKIICQYNNFRFRIAEPLKLRLARARSEKFYYPNDKEPLISVYTPTYNRGNLLMERALPSVLSQTYKNFEYIIMGDCCTDNTEELVLKVNDPRIRFYNIPKRGYRYPPTAENHWLAGPVAAANQALKMVKGKWIARIDDDDTWSTDHLEELINFAQAGSYEFVSSFYTEINRGIRREVDGEYAQGPYYNYKHEPVKGFNPKIGGTLTWLYRSYLKLFKYNINCWRKDWNRVNDIDISIRMFRAGVKMGFLEKSLALYQPRPGENTIGLAAYEESADKKEEHYKFKD